MKKFLIILVLILFVTGCGEDTMTKEATLESVIASGEYLVVDVRTSSEYEDGHVVGAINIPYNEIGEDIELDKEMPILVYCMSGGRSRLAYDALTNLGYTVYDLGAFASIDLPKE